jgi:hypothetical protein
VSTKKIYEDNDKTIYEKQNDPWGFVGELLNQATGKSTPKEYEAVAKDGSVATGSTAAEAASNLDAGKSK